jgi:AhpD family alkylhydroperoxidase
MRRSNNAEELPVGEYKDILKSVHSGTAAIRQQIPEVYADGALSGKTKELMAVAIAVQNGCDGCIASHVRSAARKGASGAEMAEAIGVALQMGGGPASIYAPRAWAAFEEFSESAASRPAKQ